ncbi:MAG: hypothetical protein ABJA70_21435 [Chryseolinea sp.]
MKTLSFLQSGIKKFVLVITLGLLSTSIHANVGSNDEPPVKEQSILIALLLDTSNSMDGLIDQAKSQLWKIVNELSKAQCDDSSRPKVKIALYEYGNDRLLSSEGYIRQVSGLTDDLDLVSERLFGLTTRGGNEYCGYVIKTSLAQLDWTTSDADLKMIFIAGNEPFTQGTVPFKVACTSAQQKGIVVNTIYCGNYTEGINTEWKKGADLTGGTYMSIDQDERTVYVATPFDDQLTHLNMQLNETYVYYGASGASKQNLQSRQDANALKYGKSNEVERAISKSSHVYKNSSWDLVDASKDNDKVLEDAKTQDLPKEMKGMSIEQRKGYIKVKAGQRKKIQDDIQLLSVKRQEYIVSQSKGDDKKMLDVVMIKSIRDQAKVKKLNWK